MWQGWISDLASVIAGLVLAALVAYATLYAIMVLRGKCDSQCTYDKDWKSREASWAARMGPE